MDGPSRFDLRQLQESLQGVDHALIRLTPMISERLLIDFRTNEHGGPGVALLPEVKSLEERMETIESARPGFDRPERINVIMWPMRVAALRRLGVMEMLRERLASLDGFDALRDLDAIYDQLLSLERDEQRRAITGEGYETLWSIRDEP